MQRILLLGLVLSMLLGCGDNDSDEISVFGSNHFFPLELDSYIDYDVRELVFRSEGQIRDTFSYQLREQISDSYTDDLGEKISLIDRSTRTNEGEAWVYQNTSQAYISDNLIIRIDDNIPFVKMELPTKSGQEWDGNQLFDPTGELIIGGESIDYFKEWNYKILSDNSTISIDNESYSSVLEVSLADHENKVEIRKAKEYYAPNIGLIKKTLFIVDTQCFTNCNNVSWEEKGEKGHIYIQEMINHN